MVYQRQCLRLRCKVEFTTNLSKRVYCRKYCKSLCAKKRKRDRLRQVVLYERACVGCQTPFIRGWRHQKYCTPLCGENDRQLQRKTAQQLLFCPIEYTEMYCVGCYMPYHIIKRGQWETRKYCTRRCHDMARKNQQSLSYMGHGPKRLLKCSNCDATIVETRTHGRPDRRFCSRYCGGKHWVQQQDPVEQREKNRIADHRKRMRRRLRSPEIENSLFLQGMRFKKNKTQTTYGE